MTRAIEIDLIHPPNEAHNASRPPTVVTLAKTPTTTTHLQATVESVPPTLPSSPVVVLNTNTPKPKNKKKKNKATRPPTLILPTQLNEGPLGDPLQKANEGRLTALLDPSTHTAGAPSSDDVAVQDGTSPPSSPSPLLFSQT
jgi:hypothetical protein